MQMNDKFKSDQKFVNPFYNDGVGRRTGWVQKKEARMDSDGFEIFDDYWSDSDQSSLSVDSTTVGKENKTRSKAKNPNVTPNVRKSIPLKSMSSFSSGHFSTEPDKPNKSALAADNSIHDLTAKTVQEGDLNGSLSVIETSNVPNSALQSFKTKKRLTYSSAENLKRKSAENVEECVEHEPANTDVEVGHQHEEDRSSGDNLDNTLVADDTNETAVSKRNEGVMVKEVTVTDVVPDRIQASSHTEIPVRGRSIAARSIDISEDHYVTAFSGSSEVDSDFVSFKKKSVVNSTEIDFDNNDDEDDYNFDIVDVNTSVYTHFNRKSRQSKIANKSSAGHKDSLTANTKTRKSRVRNNEIQTTQPVESSESGELGKSAGNTTNKSKVASRESCSDSDGLKDSLTTTIKTRKSRARNSNMQTTQLVESSESRELSKSAGNTTNKSKVASGESCSDSDGHKDRLTTTTKTRKSRARNSGMQTTQLVESSESGELSKSTGNTINKSKVASRESCSDSDGHKDNLTTTIKTRRSRARNNKIQTTPIVESVSVNEKLVKNTGKNKSKSSKQNKVKAMSRWDEDEDSSEDELSLLPVKATRQKKKGKKDSGKVGSKSESGSSDEKTLIVKETRKTGKKEQIQEEKVKTNKKKTSSVTSEEEDGLVDGNGLEPLNGNEEHDVIDSGSDGNRDNQTIPNGLRRKSTRKRQEQLQEQKTKTNMKIKSSVTSKEDDLVEGNGLEPLENDSGSDGVPLNANEEHESDSGSDGNKVKNKRVSNRKRRSTWKKQEQDEKTQKSKRKKSNTTSEEDDLVALQDNENKKDGIESGGDGDKLDKMISNGKRRKSTQKKQESLQEEKNEKHKRKTSSTRYEENNLVEESLDFNHNKEHEVGSETDGDQVNKMIASGTTSTQKKQEQLQEERNENLVEDIVDESEEHEIASGNDDVKVNKNATRKRSTQKKRKSLEEEKIVKHKGIKSSTIYEDDDLIEDNDFESLQDNEEHEIESNMSNANDGDYENVSNVESIRKTRKQRDEKNTNTENVKISCKTSEDENYFVEDNATELHKENEEDERESDSADVNDKDDENGTQRMQKKQLVQEQTTRRIGTISGRKSEVKASKSKTLESSIVDTMPLDISLKRNSRLKGKSEQFPQTDVGAMKEKLNETAVDTNGVRSTRAKRSRRKAAKPEGDEKNKTAKSAEGERSDVATDPASADPPTKEKPRKRSKSLYNPENALLEGHENTIETSQQSIIPEVTVNPTTWKPKQSTRVKKMANRRKSSVRFSIGGELPPASIETNTRPNLRKSILKSSVSPKQRTLIDIDSDDDDDFPLVITKSSGLYETCAEDINDPDSVLGETDFVPSTERSAVKRKKELNEGDNDIYEPGLADASLTAKPKRKAPRSRKKSQKNRGQVSAIQTERREIIQQESYNQTDILAQSQFGDEDEFDERASSSDTPSNSDLNVEEVMVSGKNVQRSANLTLKFFDVPRKKAFIIDPEVSENGVRRTRRYRVKPLDFWRNERPIYERRKSGGFALSGIQSPTIATPSPQIVKNKRKARTKIPKTPHNLSVHRDLSDIEFQEEVNPTITVINPSTNEEVDIDAVSTSEMNHFFGPTGKPATDTDPIAMSKCLYQKSFSAGELLIRPLQEKGLQVVRNDTMVFRILRGKLAVTIHETTSVLESGAMFFIPQGNVYNIENLRNDEAKLVFTQVKSIH